MPICILENSSSINISNMQAIEGILENQRSDCYHKELMYIQDPIICNINYVEKDMYLKNFLLQWRLRQPELYTL